MPLTSFRTAAISVWLIGLLLVVGFSLASGTPVTLTGILLVVVAGSVPPALLVTLLRSAPRTVGQVIYDTEQGENLTERLRQIERKRNPTV
jgi:hypothetical protein